MDQFKNDRCLLRLLEIKGKTHDLTKGETKVIKLLSKMYSQSDMLYLDEVDSILKGRQLIKDANVSDDLVETPDGNYYYRRISEVIDFRITEIGLEALRNETFDSEIKKRMESDGDKKFTRRYARWGFGISVGLLLKEILDLLLKWL